MLRILFYTLKFAHMYVISNHLKIANLEFSLTHLVLKWLKFRKLRGMHRNVKNQLFFRKSCWSCYRIEFLSQRRALLNEMTGVWENFSILFGDLKRSNIFLYSGGSKVTEIDRPMYIGALFELVEECWRPRRRLLLQRRFEALPGSVLVLRFTLQSAFRKRSHCFQALRSCVIICYTHCTCMYVYMWCRFT